MKVTVITDDQVVVVDGDPEFFAFTLPDPDIFAIQWDSVLSVGDIEFYSKPNETITDFSPYAFLLTDRTAARDARLAAETQAEIDKEAALTTEERRMREYPTWEEYIVATYEDRQGDPTKLNAFYAAIEAVNLKYPTV